MGAGIVVEGELGRDLIGVAGSRHIVAKNPVDLAAILRQRQSQPEEDDMVAPCRRPANDAVGGEAFFRNPGMDAAPIRGAVPGKHLVDALTGDFFAVDVAQPRSRQPEQALVNAIPEVDQAQMGKKLRHLEGIELGARRHGPLTGRSNLIVEEFTLSWRDQLGPKGAPGQHLIPPLPAQRPHLANHCEPSDYVEFACHMQAM